MIIQILYALRLLEKIIMKKIAHYVLGGRLGKKQKLKKS